MKDQISQGFNWDTLSSRINQEWNTSTGKYQRIFRFLILLVISFLVISYIVFGTYSRESFLGTTLRRHSLVTTTDTRSQLTSWNTRANESEFVGFRDESCIWEQFSKRHVRVALPPSYGGALKAMCELLALYVGGRGAHPQYITKLPDITEKIFLFNYLR